MCFLLAYEDTLLAHYAFIESVYAAFRDKVKTIQTNVNDKSLFYSSAFQTFNCEFQLYFDSALKLHNADF